MFIFIGELEPKEILKDAHVAINVGDFDVIIHQDCIICNTKEIHNDNLEQARDAAKLAMDCVVMSQGVHTSRVIKVREKSWIEINIGFDILEDKLKVGSIFGSIDLPIDNQTFLMEFLDGLKYANQAFHELTFRLALEDYSRSLDSGWDESIYHCQHCLECIKDYFGDWPLMRQQLNIEESELRKVTDFSAQYIRHGASRAKLQTLTDKEKNQKSQDAKEICQKALTTFGKHLDRQGINSSSIWKLK
jgi:hypothetical protein